MSINLTVPKSTENPELKPRITVVGVGGAGGNAVNNMIKRELEGVDFVVANTDSQSLTQSSAERRIQLGAQLTQGLGAGSKPDVGRSAAEEAIEDVLAELKGVHMLFIAAGMGGGTGTGAAPVIAQAAREAGILSVGIVTKPFQFEGSHRMKMAEQGIRELEQHVDTLIIIPNQNLFRIANENTTFSDAFNMADEVLYSGVRGVTDLIVMPGLINLDFADIRSVMEEMGKAMMGTGEASGDRRALDAAEAAIANPLLEDMSMKGAKGVLINITGGLDVTLFEVDEAATRIRSEVDDDAHIIVGSAFDPNLDGTMRVSVVATGIDANSSQIPAPTMLDLTTSDHQPVIQEVKVLELEEPLNKPLNIMEQEVEPSFEDKEVAALPVSKTSSLEQMSKVIDSNPVSLLETEQTETNEFDDKLTLEPKFSPEPIIQQEKVAVKKAIIPIVHEMGAMDAFIPPKPESVEAIPKKPQDDFSLLSDRANVTTPQNIISVNPFESERKPSLFERVTRTGRAAIGFADSTRQTNEAPVPLKSEINGEVQGSEQIESMKSDTSSIIVTAPNEAAQQNELVGLGPQPEAKRKEAETEDDMLDIPAFLRRQAN